MKLSKAVELLERYKNCPKCGSNKVGGENGKVETTESTFHRTCKCGWGVKVTLTENSELVETFTGDKSVVCERLTRPLRSGGKDG